jgi:hypothetical protein
VCSSNHLPKNGSSPDGRQAPQLTAFPFAQRGPASMENRDTPFVVPIVRNLSQHVQIAASRFEEIAADPRVSALT